MNDPVITEWAKGYAAGQQAMTKSLQMMETLAFQQSLKGIDHERARALRIVKRHLLSGGKLIWHMDKQMTAAEFIDLIVNGTE